MVTGWPLKPERLSDRIDEDNNILVETCTSNFLKSNFDESCYPSLRALVASIRIPEEYANSRLEIGPYDANLELDFRSMGHRNDGYGDEDEESEDDLVVWPDVDGAYEEEDEDEEAEE